MLYETSMSSIIRQLRVLNAAARETRDPAQWRAFCLENQYIAYEDFNETGTKSSKVQGNIEADDAEQDLPVMKNYRNG